MFRLVIFILNRLTGAPHQSWIKICKPSAFRVSDAFVFLNWYGAAKTQYGFAETFPSSPCGNVKTFYNNKKLPCGFFLHTNRKTQIRIFTLWRCKNSSFSIASCSRSLEKKKHNFYPKIDVYPSILIQVLWYFLANWKITRDDRISEWNGQTIQNLDVI